MFMRVLMRMPVPLFVPMRVGLDVDAAGHHEIAVLHPDDLDLRAVEPRQHRPGDDFVDGSEHGRAAAV